MEDHQIFTFSNGIRLVHKEVTSTKIIHCGFILDIGSRDEKRDEQGIAHFWEHMAFKGTKKRKAFHIINKLESVGGELNAFTTKEKICFYASVLDRYFEQAVDLLTDITFYSTFPDKEIVKEKQVILEEMAMYQDIPEDAIQDDFDQLIFPDQPLGWNILGNRKTVKEFNREHFLKFIRNNINCSHIVFSVVGNVKFSQARHMVEKYITDISIPVIKRERVRAIPQSSVVKIIPKRISRAHCAMGKEACSVKDDKRMPFFMLSNILGGPAMNSRLNMELRERNGFVYSIDAVYTPYTDIGILGIYFATEPRQMDKSVKIILREIRKIKESALGTIQFHKAKEQLMGQLAMAEENYVGLMLMMGKSLLDLGKVDRIEEIFSRIMKISSKELRDIANEMLNEKHFSFLYFKPQE